jgi:hypothetical protein
MKTVILPFLLLLFMICMPSCEKNNLRTGSTTLCEEKLPCTNECIFTVENIEAQTLFIGCFGKWGFVFTDPAKPESISAAIPDVWDEDFKKDSIDIIVCGIMRENKIPLLFPDPGFGWVYQVDVKKVEKK